MALSGFARTWADGHHVLAVGEDVVPDEIEVLASTRWPRARWTGRGRFTISHHSSLAGPYNLNSAMAEDLGFDEELNQIYVVETLTERGDPPYPGTMDPTGLARAFPDALPDREEGRVVDWLLAAARRLAGQVRFAPAGVVLAPLMEAAIDMTVYSPVALPPHDAVAIARRVQPAFDVIQSRYEWQGPRQDPRVELPLRGRAGAVHLDDADLNRVHAAADEFDRTALAAPEAADAYSTSADCGSNGLVWIEVGEAGPVPSVIAGLPWAAGRVSVYALHWSPKETDDLLREFPGPAHRAVRAEMAKTLSGLAREFQSATNGVVLDADGFAVAPDEL